jgi:tetratricopeptide (TPR) repeat protein
MMRGEVLVKRMLLVCVCTGLVVAAAIATSSPAVGDEKGPGEKPEALALVAQAQYRLAGGELAEGLRLFRKAAELDPANQELAEEFGLALAEGGLNDEALRQLRAVKALSPQGESTLGLLLAQSAQSPADLESAVLHLQRGVSSRARQGEARLVLAQSLVRLGRGKEAWSELSDMLEDRPDDPRLLILAGQALRQAGKFDESVEFLKRAANLPEFRQRAGLELVETLAAAGKFKEAAGVLGDFLQREGATSAGLTRWATLLARAGERSKAREVLDRVLSGDPSQREAVLLKALLEAGDGHIETAEGLYRRALAAGPDDVDAQMGLIRLLVEVRRLNEARPLLDQVWKEISDAKGDTRDPLVEVAQERATLELIDHKLEAARPWLDRCGGGPLPRRVLALWGEYFRSGEAFKEGLGFVRKAAVEDDPQTRRLQKALTAEFAIASGDDASGREVLDGLLAGDSDDVVAGLGVLERRKRFADAARGARAALARLGDAPAVVFALAAALERSGAWDEAVAEFRALLAKQPDNAASLNYLGYMFADRGVHLEEARTMLTKAVSLEPTSGAFQDSLGWVYFRLGDLDRAEKHLMEAVRLEPFDATVQEHLGDLFRARGEGAKAAESYRLALTARPEEDGQKERIEKKLGEVDGARAR